MLKYTLLLLTSVSLLIACNNKKNENKEMKYDSYLLVGTYTSGESKGINIYQFNSETGNTNHIGETELFNPSYLAISNDNNYVYAISEGDSASSKITAYAFDKEKGELKFINEQKSGNGPCFVTVNKNNTQLVTADYGGGSISYSQLIASTGGVAPATIQKFEGNGVHPTRQTKPHLHNVIYSPDERFLFANDLGTDRIYRFEVTDNQEGNFLKQTEPAFFEVKAGSGPRHTVFHPNGKYAYLITEISGDVIAFDYNTEDGLLTEIQTIKADTLNAEGSGDIQITPNGKFLYASNRLKGDGLAIFSIDEQTGLLTKIGYQTTGIHPRNFMITPNGKLLLVANRDTNNIEVFNIEETGLLTNLNKDIQLSMPVCIKYIPIK